MEVFSSPIIEINNKVNPDITFDFLQENEEFGILDLKANKSPVTTADTLFLFTIDITGSMNERVNRSSTKLAIVKHAFMSMTQYLSTVDAPIYLRIHCFNSKVTVLMDTISIKNKEGLATLYDKINSLFADYSTDIGLALTEATKYMDEYTEENPSHQICHVFMTDGNATTGITQDSALCDLVSDRHASIFIGFGNDHNIRLMKQMTNRPKSFYQYINDMEDTAIIYGESIHQYLYPAVRNVEIKFTGCLVYDWKNNVWTDCIKESIISSEASKIYQVKKVRGDSSYATIYGIPYWSTTNEPECIDVVNELPKLINCETNLENVVDLTKYMMRQKTQELLFDAKSTEDRTDIFNIKKKLRTLFNLLRKYMKDSDMLEDGFMKQLCDDVCITYRNIGTNTGNMFIMARYTSQGRQQAYAPTPRSSSRSRPDSPEPPAPRTGLQRSLTSSIRSFPAMDDNVFDGLPVVENQNMDAPEISDSEIDTYVITGNTTSCYANDATLNTMSQMTQHYP